MIVVIAMSVLCHHVAIGHQESSNQKSTAVISGRVLAGDTGRPLASTPLQLLPEFEEATILNARTDANGTYVFPDVRPGTYQLKISRAPRHVALGYGQRIGTEPGQFISVGPGQKFIADFSLPRLSALEGYVYDEFGDPAVNIRVTLFESRFVYGLYRLLRTSVPLEATTDDKGYYRIIRVPPGTYFVGALAGVFGEPGDVTSLAPSFYPGGRGLSTARPVTITANQDITGISFGMDAAKLATITGRVIDVDGRPSQCSQVSLLTSERDREMPLLSSTISCDGDGDFQFDRVPTGKYILQSRASTKEEREPHFGWTPVTIDGQRVSGITIRLSAGTNVRGHVVFDGPEAKRPMPSQVSLAAQQYGFDSTPAVRVGRLVQPDEDWNFQMRGLAGRRLLTVVSQSVAWIPLQIMMDGEDVSDVPIEFSSGTKDVEVHLSADSYTLTGEVLDADGQRSAAYSVVVFPADSAKWRHKSRLVHVVRSDQRGRFELRMLPIPEDYLAVALPYPVGPQLLEPSFFEGLQPLAVRVRVQGAGRRDIKLRLLSR